MTARQELVTALEAVVPSTMKVMPYARDIARPSRPTVMVKVDTVRPMPEARLTHRLYSFQLVLLGPSEDTHGPGDDVLDAALEFILDALDQGDSMATLPRWSEARRAVYGETIPAYEIDCQAVDVMATPPTP